MLLLKVLVKFHLECFVTLWSCKHKKNKLRLEEVQKTSAKLKGRRESLFYEKD